MKNGIPFPKFPEFNPDLVPQGSYKGPKVFPVTVDSPGDLPVSIVLFSFKEAGADLIQFHPVSAPSKVIGGQPRVSIRFYYWMTEQVFKAMFPSAQYSPNIIYSLDVNGG